jgi:Mg2+ and Co2+ transporter CorA
LQPDVTEDTYESEVTTHATDLECKSLAIDGVVAKVVDTCKFESESVAQCLEGETNYILINQQNVLTTAFEELSTITDFRSRLKVQFYGEVRYYSLSVMSFVHILMCTLWMHLFVEKVPIVLLHCL